MRAEADRLIKEALEKKVTIKQGDTRIEATAASAAEKSRLGGTGTPRAVHP
jgi:hypothetical protein